MKDNFIQLNKSNIIRLGIRTADGEDTGEYLEFDLEDIELPLKYQELLEQDKKNVQQLHNQLMIIDKRQDVKGKKLLSKNAEDRIKAINDFFKKETEVLDMFLGENGVNKLLNGRKLGWTSLYEIIEIINRDISPYLDTNMEDVEKKIKEKYGQALKNNSEVLKPNE